MIFILSFLNTIPAEIKPTSCAINLNDWKLSRKGGYNWCNYRCKDAQRRCFGPTRAQGLDKRAAKRAHKSQDCTLPVVSERCSGPPNSAAARCDPHQWRISLDDLLFSARTTCSSATFAFACNCVTEDKPKTDVDETRTGWTPASAPRCYFASRTRGNVDLW